MGSMSNERWALNDVQIRDLQIAVWRIRDAVKGLDPAMTGPCTHCGRDSARNYAEFRLSQELGGMAHKLQKIVDAAGAGSRAKGGG